MKAPTSNYPHSNQRGMAAILGLVCISAIVIGSISYLGAAVTRVANKRAVARRQIASEQILETLAATIQTGYQQYKNTATCPSGSHDKSYQGVVFCAPIGNGGSSDDPDTNCVANPMGGKKLKLCIGNDNALLTDPPQYTSGGGAMNIYAPTPPEDDLIGFSKAVAMEVFTFGSLIPTAHADLSFDPSLPIQGTDFAIGATTGSFTVPASVNCSSVTTPGNMACVSIRLCFIGTSCTDAEALFQKIAFAR